MNRNDVIDILPSVNGLSFVEKTKAGNHDIISVILKNYPAAVEQLKSDEFVQMFAGSNIKQTAFNVWNFLRKSVRYKIDEEGYQFIKLPNVLLQSGVGDCKSLSLFAAAALSVLGCPVVFRFVSFNLLNPIPSHVFVITQDTKGKEIIIDAVWPKFNETKSYFYKKDYVMKVVTMSGLGSAESEMELLAMRMELLKVLNALPASSPAKIEIRRRIAEIDKYISPGVGSVLKKIALAPGRNAYLELVRLNVRGIAARLNSAIVKDSGPVRAMWEKLGGKYSKLVDAVNAGKSKNPLFGSSGSVPGAFSEVPENPVLFSNLAEANAAREKYKVSGVGAVPAVAALLAAAAPVIATVGNFLTKVLGASESDSDLLNDAYQAGGDVTAYDGSVSPSDDENVTVIPGVPNIVTFGGGALILAKLAKLI